MAVIKRDSFGTDFTQKQRRTCLYGGIGLTLAVLSVLYYFLGPGALPFIKTGAANTQLPDDTKMTTTTTVPPPGLPDNTTTVKGDEFTLSPEQEQINFWIGIGLAVGSSLFIGTSFILKKLGLLSVGKKTGGVRAGRWLYKQLLIDIGLAVGSSLFIGTSFILKKLGLLSVSKTTGGVRAGDGGHKYLLEWKWWSGMILMMFGEVMNFVAYSFAPASLVTPLGALSVIFAALLASYFLKEGLNLLGKLGCALCIIGSTIMVLHAPKDQEIQNMDQLLEKVSEPGILILVGILIVAAAVTIIFIEPKYGQTNVVVYVFICSSLGALTVQGCKGLGVAVMETIGGTNEFTNWLTYVMLAIVVVNILFQLNYLNKALDTFNTAVVTPTYYVMFSSFVIVVSLVLFKEFLKMSAVDIVGDLCGFLTIVGGIFLLNAFKDMDITYRNLPKAKKEGAAKDKDDSSLSKDSFLVDHDHNNVFGLDENCSLDESYGLLNEENQDFLPKDTEQLIERTPYYDNPAYEVDDIKIQIGSKSNKLQLPVNGEVTHF